MADSTDGVDENLRAKMREYVTNIEEYLDLSAEVRVRHSELRQRWNDTQDRLVQPIRAARPTPSSLTDWETLLGQADDLAGRWERMCRDDAAMGVARDTLRTEVEPLARMANDPQSSTRDIATCMARSWPVYENALTAFATSVRANHDFTESLKAFDATATGYLFPNREKREKKATRRRIYPLLALMAPIAVVALVILVVNIVVAVNH
ncbi:MAG TPA: hypothetical protein VFX70_07890 [Mycobacteriales bacterium]|nr:hypothetical protein [Mycobacteriales bacterium]